MTPFFQRAAGLWIHGIFRYPLNYLDKINHILKTMEIFFNIEE